MKILTLSTFPFGTPRHGGQHRMSNLVETYRASGHDVRSVGVLGSPLYAPEPGFLPTPSNEELRRFLHNTFLMEDWVIGRMAAEDDAYFEQLTSMITESPDLIHVEHPWLFAYARRYVRSRGLLTAILYGSANVEHILKRTIVESYIGEEHAKVCERLVLACEEDAAAHADLACAVSEGDARWLGTHGASDVVVAANGVRERTVDLHGIDQTNRIVGHHKYALYCASGHPPNIVGFYEMFGRGVGCLSPEERLVVVGSAGSGIRGNSRFGSVPGLSRHFVDAGEVDEQTLQGLIHCAHALILPITQGGGTNLKTAEALWSGRHVVATPKAMRGFEIFIGQAGVSVCDDDIAFRHGVRDRMAAPPLRLDALVRDSRRPVLWSSTLRPLMDRVNTLTAPRR